MKLSNKPKTQDNNFHYPAKFCAKVLLFTNAIGWLAAGLLGAKPDAETCALVFLIAAIISTCLWLYMQSLTVIVENNGVLGFDGFGRYHFVKWSEMEEVQPFKVLWMPYLKVNQLWIPLFLSQYQRFVKLISETAPVGNPLCKELLRLDRQRRRTSKAKFTNRS